MKFFSCGDVVPGCDAHWQRDTADDILAAALRAALTERSTSRATASSVNVGPEVPPHPAIRKVWADEGQPDPRPQS